MGFEYLSNVSLAKAKEDYLNLLLDRGYGPENEVLPVWDADGRVTACAVYANISAPHYAACAMDGVAVQSKDSFGATETTPVTLEQKQYIVVDTGDPLPELCDAVIMVEDIVKNEDGSITIHAPAAPWQHIRQIGEDICAGEMILPSNMQITPAAIGAMIAGGVLEVEVIRKPKVGIIPTGDEIIPPCSNPESGDILEFNGAIFSAMLRSWGAEAHVYPIVPDDFDKIKAMAIKAAEECDLVILNAGSSAGREDYSARVIKEVGEVLYHGIAIKPGKPTILGLKKNKPILGVPGYPVSGIIVIEELLKPLINYWLRAPSEPLSYASANLTRPVVSSLKHEEFVRVRMGYVGDKLTASPLSRGSGVVSSFMKADGIIEVPQGLEGYEAGSNVEVRLLSSLKKLENTLVVIGSHDPLLDELADMLHLRNNESYMSSSHVGSMGGIMAVRRGEAHAAGCHLLDTDTGEYNVSFIRKYFPNGGVKLVRCVGREQGLIVAKGNPLNIRKFSDIAKEGIRYVNRQKGSGTRILTDYMCRKEQIDTSGIYGYDREEFTHTSVAVQIASGSADVGMGIYSAAKIYDLDFIPICIEEYDLLVPDYAWGLPQLDEMLEILRSKAFKERLLALGGYTIDKPGEIISLD